MSEVITSTANPRIKNYRKLRDRKYRTESGLFAVEGLRIVAEAIEDHWPITELIIASELNTSSYMNDLIEQAQKSKISILNVSADVFRSLSIKDGPKGVAAVLSQQWGSMQMITRAGGMWIGLDRIQDPGNLGTILRTADSVGARGIVLIDDCTDPFDPTAVRASMGALFSIPVVKTSAKQLIELIQTANLQAIGTSDSGSTDFRKPVYNQDMLLLMGSERQGLSQPLQDVCSELVFIPMQGKSDSLNLAVATAICAYEIYRQNNPLSEG